MITDFDKFNLFGGGRKKDLFPPAASGTLDILNSPAGTVYDYDASGIFTGGEADSYEWVGTPPPWATLNTATCRVTGTSTEGTWSGYAIKAVNTKGSATSNTDSVTISAAASGAKGLLPSSDFFGHENSTITSITIPSITKKNATGEAPFALSVNSSATSCVGTRNKSGEACNPQIDLETRWELKHLDGSPIDFKNDPLMSDPNGVIVNPYTGQFGNGARFLIREAGQYTLTQTSKGDDGAGGYVTQTFSETITVTANTQTHRWIDGSAGNDANDGLDPHGFSITAGTYTDATKTLTKVGAFTSLTLDSEYPQFSANYIYLTGGTGITAGLYEIESKTSNDAIVLKTSAGSDSSDVTTSTGAKQTFDNNSVAGEMTHLRGGQVYLSANNWNASRGTAVGVVGYSGQAEIKADTGSTGLVRLNNNIADLVGSSVYFGNIYYNGNAITYFSTSNGAQTSTADTTLTSWKFDNVKIGNTHSDTGFLFQSTKDTKPTEMLLWDFHVSNKRTRRNAVVASDMKVFYTSTTQLAFTGWSGAGSPDATLDYSSASTSEKAELNNLLTDDIIYINHSSGAAEWIVTSDPSSDTVGVTKKDASDAFNSAAGNSIYYAMGSITVDSMPVGVEDSGCVEVPSNGVRDYIPLPYFKKVGNRFYLSMFSRLIDNLLNIGFNSGDTLYASESRTQGMFTNIVEADGYMGAVGIKVETGSVLKIYEHSWYENGYHDNFCTSCIEIGAEDWVGFGLNINMSSNTNADVRANTSVTNFKFSGGSYDVDLSNSYNDTTQGLFGNGYVARGVSKVFQGFTYQASCQHLRLVGVNHASLEGTPAFYHYSQSNPTNPENFDVAISRCKIYDTDLSNYNTTASIEAWGNTIHNTRDNGYGAEIYPASMDVASHQYVYDNELYLSGSVGNTPYGLDGANVNLSTFNASSGGGNTANNPNFVDPLNGDFTIVVLAPVLGTLDLPEAEVDTAYSFFVNTIQTSGNSADSWTLESGSLGSGLSFNTTTSEISGTPTAATTLSGLSFSATNSGGTSATTNTDDLVINANAPELLFNNTDISADITQVTGLVTGDYIKLTFNVNGNAEYLFDGASGSSGNRTNVRFAFNRVYIGGAASVDIDGTSYNNVAFISHYYDGNDHVLTLTIDDNNGRDIDRIGRSNANGNFANGIIKDVEISKGGVITKYNINSGSTTTESASVGTGTMTFNNVEATDWI